MRGSMKLMSLGRICVLEEVYIPNCSGKLLAAPPVIGIESRRPPMPPNIFPLLTRLSTARSTSIMTH